MPYIYTWVPAYQQIATKLANYSTNHSALVNELEVIGVEGFNDQDAPNSTIRLNDIDPFTFLSYLNKYGDDRRIIILNNLCARWDIDVKVYDVCGIPSSDARKVWLFPYQFERTQNEIDRLWSLYHSVMNNTLTNDELIEIQTIRSVGWTKITEGLFELKPEQYLPFNSVVNPYLISNGITVNYQSYDGIVHTCWAAQQKINKPFYQISYEGWLHGEEIKRQPKFWRLGTKIGDSGASVLPEMLDNDVASIGWDNLGDLKSIAPLNKTEVQKRLFQQNYPGDNRTASRKAGEIMNFIESVWLNDYIIAMDGAQVKAIGRVLHNRYLYLAQLSFPHCRVVEWLDKDVKGLVFDEGLRTTLTPINDKTNITKIQNYMDKIASNATSDNEALAVLNQILYGPPGTGKTYNSIDVAVKIIKGVSGDHAANKPIFDKLKEDGQIEFITFHQNYSYEDFMVGLRPDPEVEILKFKPYKGAFYKICQKAKDNYLAFKENRKLIKDFDTVLSEYLEPLESDEEIVVKMASDNKSFRITALTNYSLRFRKQGGSTDHTLSLDTLRDLVAGVRSYPLGLKSYYKPIVDILKEKKQGESSDTPILKNFVLIIDEINRANISKVFGELITLLEDDKRLGADNELTITLPNGENNFGVPPNLYVVGTMNTADKSIALIDIALRRRFEFIGKYPDYSVLEEKGLTDHGKLLKAINKAIYDKKHTADYLIGHAYFLSKDSIKNILLKKVIPLLNEYFGNRNSEVIGVFSETDWTVNFNENTYSWEVARKVTPDA